MAYKYDRTNNQEYDKTPAYKHAAQCLATWLFLTALSSLQCRVAMGTPLRGPDELDTEKCVSFSRKLLSKVTEVLGRDELFKGFNCSEQSILLDRNETVAACEPNASQNGRCSGHQNTGFNQNECLRNIKEDLEYYRATLLSYQKAELSSTVVKAIQELLEHCAFTSQPWTSSTSVVPSVHKPTDNPFNQRRQLCERLKGFQVRTITINRVMSYLAAEERKI
ncbi:interleukin-12 subunit alpha [Megalops cyprinoides]|uniref:interleukin-12 subunit alpha n=1 Tax=Megalops cyprinoides TaxID=118141 RepID=UPI001864D4D4|nr:interleukin-12 subunit alpha [Megalops cyprinoides]